MLRSSGFSSLAPIGSATLWLRDPATEAEVVAETRAALALGALGTPTLSLSGSNSTLLGPVLGAVPNDAEALELWDTVWFALRHPYLYELKRNRDRGLPKGLRAD